MAYGELNDHLTDDVTWPWKVVVVTPIRSGPISQKQLELCYLATIANYWVVCCEAVWSAILATALFLILNCMPCGKLMVKRLLNEIFFAGKVIALVWNMKLGAQHGGLFDFLNRNTH